MPTILSRWLGISFLPMLILMWDCTEEAENRSRVGYQNPPLVVGFHHPHPSKSRYEQHPEPWLQKHHCQKPSTPVWCHTALPSLVTMWKRRFPKKMDNHNAKRDLIPGLALSASLHFRVRMALSWEVGYFIGKVVTLKNLLKLFFIQNLPRMPCPIRCQRTNKLGSVRCLLQLCHICHDMTDRQQLNNIAPNAILSTLRIRSGNWILKVSKDLERLKPNVKILRNFETKSSITTAWWLLKHQNVLPRKEDASASITAKYACKR